MKRYYRVLLFAVFMCFTGVSHAQKVKYKDLFELLRTKKYDEAEPFLKRYLVETDDNPNAFLFMGIIYQEKAAKADPLKDQDGTITLIDSAVYFFNKAKPLITEKELKRNDEYYEAYNRRDLRTGAFGVSLSDVQLDLEKRVQGLNKQTENIKLATQFFTSSQDLYERSRVFFAAFQERYQGKKEMYLQSGESTVKELTVLGVRFDSCVKAFDNYKLAASNIGKIPYDQKINLVEISDIKSDGKTPADFFQNDLRLWDYGKFASSTIKGINEVILPFYKHLLAYDIEINKLREKLNNTLVSVTSDLTKLGDHSGVAAIKEFDPDPMPYDLFALKIADLNYKSIKLETAPFADSANVYLQISMAKNELDDVKELDSLSNKFKNRDIDSDAANYESFVNTTYHSIPLLKSYIASLGEVAQRELAEKTTRLNQLNQSKDWMIAGNDSIPLLKSGSTAKFMSLLTVEDQYTTGISYKADSTIEGYFLPVTLSRKAANKIVFPVDQKFKPQLSSDGVTVRTIADSGGQIFFVLCVSKESDIKFPCTLAKISRSDGLSWSSNASLLFLPDSMEYVTETGVLVAKDSNGGAVTFDKTGKLVAAK